MRLEHRFDNINPGCTELFYCVTGVLFVCFYYFYSDAIPSCTYGDLHTHELFACNNAAVSGGKLPQPLFDATKDNGIRGVTRGWSRASVFLYSANSCMVDRCAI